MRAFASIQVISTDALEGLFDLERAAAVWVGETEARAETATPKLGKWRIPVHELSAQPAATQKLLDDASLNMEAWLAQKVALEFALAENAAFVNGTGAERPRGFLTYADGTTLPGTIERVKTTVNGDFAAAPAGGDILIDALYSLKAPYRANATWFMNRATFAKVRKLKDSDGAYIWSPGIAAGQPATLLGYPTASFEDMPDPATGSLSIAVGDMRAAYQIVDRAGIRVLRDPYTSKPFILLYTTKRTGGDVVNFEALKLIEFSAS
jgi:HK97 family phage major capsid protein